MSSAAADRARQKAEARRQRILSKSADRLGVVSGIVAPSILKDGGGGEVIDNNNNASSPTSSSSSTPTASAASVATAKALAADSSANGKNTVDDRDEKSTAGEDDAAADAATTATITDNSNSADMITDESGRGARRMAAMRRRRYQSKTTVLGEEVQEAEKIVEVDDANAKHVEKSASTSTALPLNTNTDTMNISQMGKKESSVINPESTMIEPSLANEDDAVDNNDNNKTKKTQQASTVVGDRDEKKKDEAETAAADSKKYMGGARIRRQKVKEQKAQRLKDITDADIFVGASSPSRSDLVREISAEVATMDITASMVRRGGMVVDDNTIGKWASTRGLWNSKRRSWKWYTSLVVPPMKLVPRLITLLLLFFVGLDLGTQPYRPSSYGMSVDRDFTLNTGGRSSLIGHAELSLTKPWEYGMGGKVAYMVGMTTASPPTALPTTFWAANDILDDDDDVDIAATTIIECDATDEVGSNKAECGSPRRESEVLKNSDYIGGGEDDAMTMAATGTKTKDNKKKNKNAIKEKEKEKKKNNIKIQLMEDEFDSTRTRPRGVANQHHHDHHHDGIASEFDDDNDLKNNNNKNINIDPLFQVDLDALLYNAHLPLPIDYAAKFAIGFHRTWVHYLWKLPTSFVKSIFGIPINLVSGWISNPPWILGVVLLIRFITKVLVGTTASSGKSFSLDSDNDDDAKGNSGGGGGGGGNLDVLEKVMGAAKNYASSMFPRTSLVFGTLMQVMKVDMYVVLCGMLIGLVMCSFDDVKLGWVGEGSRISSNEAGNGGAAVLGDGEL